MHCDSENDLYTVESICYFFFNQAYVNTKETLIGLITRLDCIPGTLHANINNKN